MVNGLLRRERRLRQDARRCARRELVGAAAPSLPFAKLLTPAGVRATQGGDRRWSDLAAGAFDVLFARANPDGSYPDADAWTWLASAVCAHRGSQLILNLAQRTQASAVGFRLSPKRQSAIVFTLFNYPESNGFTCQFVAGLGIKEFLDSLGTGIDFSEAEVAAVHLAGRSD